MKIDKKNGATPAILGVSLGLSILQVAEGKPLVQQAAFENIDSVEEALANEALSEAEFHDLIPEPSVIQALIEQPQYQVSQISPLENYSFIGVDAPLDMATSSAVSSAVTGVNAVGAGVTGLSTTALAAVGVGGTLLTRSVIGT